MQHLFFSVWLISLSTMPSRITHVVANHRISFLLRLNYIYILYIYIIYMSYDIYIWYIYVIWYIYIIYIYIYIIYIYHTSIPWVSAEWWRPQKGESSCWINTAGRSWVGLTVTSLLTLAVVPVSAADWSESHPLVPAGYPSKDTGQEV